MFFGGLINLVVPLLILNLIHEDSKVRLVNDLQGNVRFRRADEESESSSDEKEIEADLELDDWLNDTMTRRDLFERKMDARTSRDSLIKRGAEWIGL